MIVTKEWIAENYKKFNNLYWDGKLPKNITFKVGVSRKSWGLASCRYDSLSNSCYDYKITMSNYFDSPEVVKINTLLHEMIHIYDYAFYPEHVTQRRYDAHGLLFLKEANRLRKFGWDINNKVTYEEHKVSSVSDEINKRIENKIREGFLLFVSKRNGYSNYQICKINESQYNQLIRISRGQGFDCEFKIVRYFPKNNEDSFTKALVQSKSSLRSCWTKNSEFINNEILVNSKIIVKN